MNEQAKQVLRDLRASGYQPPDGVMRPIDRERELNLAFLAVAQTDAGQAMLAALRAMCVPLPRGYDDATVRERNAMAWMVSVIEQRIEHGRHGRPAVE